MIIIALNSDLDNFIITLIVGAMVFIFFLKWVKDKIKSRKILITTFQNSDIEDQLSNYTFNFKDNVIANKAFGIKTKMISILISLIIIAIPLYEFVETLRPVEFFFGWNCLPFNS